MVKLTIERQDYPELVEVDVWHGAEDRAVAAYGMPSPNFAAVRGEGAILSVGPNRYYFVDAAADTARSIGAELASCIDLSSARTRFRLTGERSARLINKGAALDLRASACPEHSVLMSGIGNVPVAIHQNAAVSDDCFDVYCYASFGDALADWLANAARGE